MIHSGEAGRHGATVSDDPKAGFRALAQGRADYTIPVVCSSIEGYGDLMTICATEEVIYVSKEQAMAFFGLKEGR